MTEVRAESEQQMPALAMLMVCCSMASSSACCSAPILSNSSMQHAPWSPSTSAPASSPNSPDTWSRTMVTVSPVALVVLPHTYTPRGATLPTVCSICDLPMPGSPTTSMCGSARTPTDACPSSDTCDPPISASMRPILTHSWPKMEGHSDATTSSSSRGCSAISLIASMSRSLNCTTSSLGSCRAEAEPLSGDGPSPPVPAPPPAPAPAPPAWVAIRCASSVSTAPPAAAAPEPSPLPPPPLRAVVTEMASTYRRKTLAGRPRRVDGSSTCIAFATPTTVTTSPGMQQSTKSSLSSTSTVRGMRPASRWLSSTSWTLIFCQSTVRAPERMGSKSRLRQLVISHLCGGSNRPSTKVWCMTVWQLGH
mmetsp:Transcript_24918/g.80263  ORF Transcript_24918/g.80263 Transcript_24918/m.80263 type:complete len:365 (-) Transcript_24918:503-1597(-)